MSPFKSENTAQITAFETLVYDKLYKVVMAWKGDTDGTFEWTGFIPPENIEEFHVDAEIKFTMETT